MTISKISESVKHDLIRYVTSHQHFYAALIRSKAVLSQSDYTPRC
jgi:hypothetical protein